MATYKEYNNDQYLKWLSRPFSENYGISEESIASWFVTQRGASPVMNSYGVNKDNLLSTYIPQLKAGLGGGYVNFLIITVNEGGGAGNWINHYGSDTSSTGTGTMQDDIDYINTLLNTVYPPAKGAPEVLGGTPYTDDPGQDTQGFYNQLPNGSIGKYYMPATMAGNAWVFGTNWCVNNAVYFGNPYDTAIDTIKSTGADPFDGSGGGGNNAQPDPNNGAPHGDDLNPANLTAELQKFLEKVLNEVKKAMTNDVHAFSNQSIYSNNFLVVTRTFGNTYRVKMRKNWLDKFIKNSGELNPDGNKPKPDNSKPNDSPSSGGGSDTAQRIAKWCRDNLGQSYDMDGVYGAQCVDMIAAVNHFLNLNLNTGNYNGSMYAKDIWNNPVPAGWHKTQGDPNNDTNSANIWNGLPDGAIVWFTNGGAGHVAVKTGGWATCIQQNYNTPGWGGPMVEVDISPWIQSGGAGFLGAWVPD